MEAFYPNEEATASFQHTIRINPLSDSMKSRRSTSSDFNMEINPLRASRPINVATPRSSSTSRTNLLTSTSTADGQLEHTNDYIDEVLAFLGLSRFRINCNKLLFDGIDLHAEILTMERRNLSLEQELSMWKTSSETQAAELRNEIARANEEVSTVKEQLDSTIAAADKCIEELEEQIRKSEEEKLDLRTLADKRVIDLEELLRKTRDDKATCAGMLGNTELELKRQKEEVAALVARNNFLKAEGDSRVGLVEDKLRVSEEGRIDLQKQLNILSSSRDAAEKNGREIQLQHDKISAELTALKTREAQGNVTKQQLKEKITELETQSKNSNAEIARMLSQLQEVNDAKKQVSLVLSSVEYDRRKDMEEISRLSKLLQEANAAKAAEEVRYESVMDQLKVANEEIAHVARKANSAKAVAEEMVMQLEAKNKQLTEALSTKDKDLSQSSATKAYAEKVMTELKTQSKKTADSLTATEIELQKVAAGKMAAEKAMAEISAERQKSMDEWTSRIRELEAMNSGMKFETDRQQGELKAQVRKAEEELLVRVRQLSDITTEKAAADRRAVDLEARVTLLDGENKLMKRQLEELLTKQINEDRKDKRRITDLREVNDQLLRFARDRRIQEILQRPRVKIALALWGGMPVNQLSEAELENVRTDEGVEELFPVLKRFEEVCDKAKIKFPNDHIQQGLTQLTADAVTYAFGPDFVALHHVELHFDIPDPSSPTNHPTGGIESPTKK